MKNHLLKYIFLCLLVFIPSFLQAYPDSTQTGTRTGYEQNEFTFINEYNRMLWKFLRAIDEVKDGHYKSELKWKSDSRGKITSLIPYVDNSLFTGQSMLRTLNNDRGILTKVAFDDNSHRLTEMFQRAIENAQEGTDEILKYYATPWKLQTEAQAGEVQKKGGWTKAWEAMRDMVTKSRAFFSAIRQSDSPRYPYVEAKVVDDLLPPVVEAPLATPGSPFFGLWLKVGTTQVVVSEPLPAMTAFKVDDVILGVYKFGSITTGGDAELDPTSGAERTLVETPSIVSFVKTFNDRRSLVGKTLRFLVRRQGREVKVDVKCEAAEGGNLFQR